MALGYRTLSRKSFQRKALFRDLITDLILNGRIETTISKAKELKRLADKMVTLGKKGDLAARRQAAELIRFEKDEEGNYALQKLFSEIAPKYTDRNGGYTRVLKLGPRRGDASETGDLLSNIHDHLRRCGGFLHAISQNAGCGAHCIGVCKRGGARAGAGENQGAAPGCDPQCLRGWGRLPVPLF